MVAYADFVGPIPSRHVVEGGPALVPDSELNMATWHQDRDAVLLVQAGMRPEDAVDLIRRSVDPDARNELSTKDAVTVRLMTGPHDETWKRVAEVHAYRSIAGEIESGRLETGYAKTEWSRDDGTTTMQLMAVSADTVQISRVRREDGFLLHDRDLMVAEGRVAYFKPELGRGFEETDRRDLAYRVEGARLTRAHLEGDPDAAASIPDMGEARTRILARHSALGSDVEGRDAETVAAWSAAVSPRISPSAFIEAEKTVDPLAHLRKSGIVEQARSATASRPTSSKGPSQEHDIQGALLEMSRKTATRH